MRNQFPIWSTTCPRSPQDGVGQKTWEEEDLSQQRATVSSAVCKTTAPHLLPFRQCKSPVCFCHRSRGSRSEAGGDNHHRASCLSCSTGPPQPPAELRGKQGSCKPLWCPGSIALEGLAVQLLPTLL